MMLYHFAQVFAVTVVVFWAILVLKDRIKDNRSARASRLRAEKH
jgi:hypothetical protein